MIYLDVERLYQLIAEAQPPFDKVEQRAIVVRHLDVQTMLKQNGVEPKHVSRILADKTGRINEPGIICDFGDDTQIIADGSHRYVARYKRKERLMDFWWLVPEQWKLAQLDPMNAVSF